MTPLPTSPIPDLTTIEITSDHEALLQRFFERALARFTPGQALGPPDLTFPSIAPRAAAFPAARQQVHVFLGHLGITRADPDYAPLVVMDHVLDVVGATMLISPNWS